MEYKVIQKAEDTWVIEEEGVRFFLLTGTRKALLIDSGMNVHHAKEIAEGLTSLPIELINTHADPDHIGSNGEFESFYMHPAEAVNYYKGHDGSGTMIPVWDGDVIDLGKRALRVIHIPGHTPGSIALLDCANKVLYSGDSVQNGTIFMFGPYREMHALICSLEKLDRIKDEFEVIYPCHGQIPVKPEQIRKIIVNADRILHHEIDGEPGCLFGKNFLKYTTEDAVFLCDE